MDDLEDTPRLFVDKLTDKFDATPPCEAPYCRLHDTLDFVPQQIAMFDDFLLTIE